MDLHIVRVQFLYKLIIIEAIILPHSSGNGGQQEQKEGEMHCECSACNQFTATLAEKYLAVS